MKYNCLTRLKRRLWVRQRGSMLMISVFSIVVLSALGISMARLSGSSSTSVVYEVHGFRALNAARSGLEQKVRDVFAAQTSDPTRCDADGTDNNLWVQQDFNATKGMENCSVIALCTVTQVEGASYFRFESQGLCELEDEGIVVSRTLAIDARDVP